MNTFMWESPFTKQHLEVLQKLGAQVIPPVGKRLACGDVGLGAMAAPEDIAVACIEAMGRRYGAGGRRDDEEAVAVVPAG
ncbi:putative phosphopantothenoylcysteinedecarboxylase [Monoraphidium neglectum]|uniref:Putative phosphopantothenoylcysteinedecarboxylase n=1 Tax=Monoraphidium neglectum TaxID=145388 RepID=A0A0D2LGU6_9CHLO|nr:putative phosphopantothenoylcysteinedecarboxylase [Monoraphidium neglectum]KIZ05704.1 putative phosphopantothenoylcysteinedecarboxylase [Monoraphidium neglectum]|eukprot:XP_013904723.1 putative phosphopantothenoylcysteinedecarboxylase [Monoraphidium neglectum]